MADALTNALPHGPRETTRLPDKAAAKGGIPPTPAGDGRAAAGDDRSWDAAVSEGWPRLPRIAPRIVPGRPGLRRHPMFSRTTRKTVTFSHPFVLPGVDGVQPAGTYTVETDEELVEGVSFPVYRRVATVILLPPPAGGAGLFQAATIDPLDLERAEHADAAATP